jgi:hypothetical protein
MSYDKHKMKTHSPSGHAEKHDTKIHQRGMRTHSPSGYEHHPKGPSVDTSDRPSAEYVPSVSVPGPRNA